MEDVDVWQLSWLMKSRVIMKKFRGLLYVPGCCILYSISLIRCVLPSRQTLLQRLAAANARDLSIDCMLTVGNIATQSLFTTHPSIACR